MKQSTTLIKTAFHFLFFYFNFFVITAQTLPTAHSFSFSENFSSLLHNSTIYPSSIQGWKVGGSSSSSFRTSAPTSNENLNSNSSASTTTGGIHNYNGKIGLLASSSTDPSLVIALNTLGYQNISINFDVMTIRNPYNSTTNTRINNLELQYRVGNSLGAFNSISGSFYHNNTVNQIGSGITTPQNIQSITIQLPVQCNNQPFIQLRWVQRDSTGTGSRPSFAFDNICISAEASGVSNNLFNENMGTVANSTSIDLHEINNGFANGSYTMVGTADIRSTQNSNGQYPEASGGANVFFTSTTPVYFQIEGINTIGQNNLELSFGLFKGSIASNGSSFVVEVSSDGINFSSLSFGGLPTGEGTAVWKLITASGAIPQTSNLRIRFRQTDENCFYRIDDVKLEHFNNSSLISTNGPIAFCQGGSVGLTAPNGGTSYLWSTGETNQSITVGEQGGYTVALNYGQGCTIVSDTLFVFVDTIHQSYAGLDTVIFLGQSVQIGSTPILTNSYNWTPSSGLSDSTIANPFATPTSTMNYILSVPGKCSDTIKVSVDAVVNGIIEPDTVSSSVNKFDVIDRFGSSYTLDEIAIPHHSEIAGMFRLHFLDDDLNNNVGFDNNHPNGNERRAVLRKVCEDITVLLGGGLANNPYPDVLSPCNNSSDPFPDCRFVELEVRESAPVSNMPSSALAAASQYYLASGQGIAYGNVWTMINSGWDPYYQISGSPLVGQPNSITQQYYHGYVQVNFNDAQTDWYTNLTNTSISPNQFDLYSVMLHEILHALGLASLINNNAQSAITGTSTPGAYSLWDTYLSTSQSGSPNVLTNSTSCNNVGISTSAGDIATGCSSFFFNGINLTGQQIFSPSPYQQGSSLSHFNCISGAGCPSGYSGNGYSLNFCTSQGSAWVQRTPHQNEVFALCDLGYTISNTYGTNPSLPSFRNNYNTCAAGCPNDLTVAGVNDINVFSTDNSGSAFLTPFQTAITFVDYNTNGSNSLLDNDFNAVGIGCVKVLIGGTNSNITVNSSTNFIYTPPTNFCGQAVLSYRPVNACGHKGNETFIFVQVSCPPLPVCEISSVCGENLVLYGDLEDFINENQMRQVLTFNPMPTGGWQAFQFSSVVFDNSPDFNLSYVPSNWSCGGGTVTGITANTGNNYLGLIIRTSSTGENSPEGPAFKLCKPIPSNTSGTISFYARLGNISCSNGTYIQARFTENAPCSGQLLTNAACPNLNPSSILPFTNGIAITNNSWQQYTFQFTNNSGTDWNYLILNGNSTIIRDNSPGNPLGYLFLDDVSVSINEFSLDINSEISNTNPCPGNTTTISYDICNNNNSVNPEDINLLLNLPDNLTLVGGDFSSLGDATISLGNLGVNACITLEAIVQVNVNSLPGVILPVQLELMSGGCINGNAVIDNIKPGLPGLTMDVEISNLILSSCNNNNNNNNNNSIVTVTINNNTIGNLSDVIIEYDLPSGIMMNNSGNFSNQSGAVFSTDPFGIGQGATTVLTFEISNDNSILGIVNNCISVVSASAACNLPEQCFDIELKAILSVNTNIVNCVVNNDGAVIAIPSGGAPPYSYSWNTTPIQTTQTATGLPIGSYTVTVTDNDNCSTTNTISVDYCTDFLMYDCHLFLDANVFSALPDITHFFVKAMLYTSSDNSCSGSGSPIGNNIAGNFSNNMFNAFPDPDAALFPDPITGLNTNGWWTNAPNALGQLGNHICLSENHGLYWNPDNFPFAYNQVPRDYSFQLYAYFNNDLTVPATPIGSPDCIYFPFYPCSGPPNSRTNDPEIDIMVIESEIENIDLQIFPNPAQNEVSVLITATDKETEMSVCTITGQEIVKFRSIKSEEVFNVKISDWESGIYYCKVKHGDHYTVKRFTIIK